MGSLAWPLAAQQVAPPSAVPQQSQSGGDSITAELIKNISTPISPELVRNATTPVAGPHSGQVPSSLQTPVPSHQNMPFNNNPVVGRKNGRLQGIGNAITGATNAIGAVVSAEAQVKQDHIKDGATKVIMAQQGIDEAKQAHDAAIASGDAAAASKAQEMIQKNTQARDSIFADPKMRKALAKGFDISYTDPSSNKTEEHAAVQAAMKQAKTLQEKKQIQQDAQNKQNQEAATAAGAAYEKAQPQGMAPNQQALGQLSVAQAQQKANQETLKSYLTYKGAAMRANATVTAAQIHAQGAAMMEQTRLANQQNMLAQRFQQQEKLQSIHFNDELKLIGARAATARENAMDIYRDKEADPLTMYNKTRTAAESYSKNYMHDLDTYNKMIAGRASLYTDNNGKPLKNQPSPDDVKQYDNQVELVKQQVQLDKNNADNFEKQANNLRDSFGISQGQGGNDGGSDSTSSDSTDSAGGSEYDDPLSFTN